MVCSCCLGAMCIPASPTCPSDGGQGHVNRPLCWDVGLLCVREQQFSCKQGLFPARTHTIAVTALSQSECLLSLALPWVCRVAHFQTADCLVVLEPPSTDAAGVDGPTSPSSGDGGAPPGGPVDVLLGGVRM